MSSSPESAPNPPALPTRVRIVSHTGVVYWWPVWLVGIILGAITWFDDQRLVMVPDGTKVERQSAGVFVVTVPAEGEQSMQKAADNTKANKEAFSTRVAGNESLGMTWVAVFLLVLVGANVPFRGLASLVVVLLLVVVAGVLAWLDVWGRIFEYLGGLHVYMSAEAFLVPSVGLLAVWLLTVFGYDQLRHMTFTPGQFVVVRDIGDQRQVFNSTQTAVELKKVDYFRHWLLGFGAGDLIVRIPNQGVTFEFFNVLFVNHKLQQISDLMKLKPVVQR